MLRIIGKIRLIGIFILLISGLSSCVYDYPADLPSKKGDEVVLILDIKPATSSVTNIGVDHEKVKSMRVIMLSNGSLEVNRRYDVASTLASDFSATYTYKTSPGEKEIYLIANEDEIKDYNFTSNADLPAKPAANMKDLLNSFPEGETGSIANGKGMKAVLESLYFPPAYNQDGKGDYYLPYVSYYPAFIVLDNDRRYEDNPIKMYLVPVATKFYFNFTNNRPSQVELSNIEIKSFNNLNFMIARVEDEEQYKVLNGEKLYWIDWLAKISELSHQFPEYGENINFNNLYGWINGYSMPASSTLASKKFLDGMLVIDAAETEKDDTGDNDYKVITPGTLSLGPFYMPESWNEYTYYDTLTEQELTIQQYTLTLGLHDVSTEPLKDPFFTDIPIDNLKSLFRNTHVIINVTMNAGNLEIYAEITGWDVHHSQGYVIDTKP